MTWHWHKWGKWENSSLTLIADWCNTRTTVSAQRRYCTICGKKKVRKV